MLNSDINPHGLVCYKAPGQPARTYGRSYRKRFVTVKAERYDEFGNKLVIEVDIKSYRVVEAR